MREKVAELEEIPEVLNKMASQISDVFGEQEQNQESNEDHET